MKYVVRSQKSQNNFYAANKLIIRRKSVRLATNTKRIKRHQLNKVKQPNFLVEHVTIRDKKEKAEFLIDMEQDAQPHKKFSQFNTCDVCHKGKAEIKCRETGCRKFFHRKCIINTLQTMSPMRCLIHYKKYYCFPIEGQEQCIFCYDIQVIELPDEEEDKLPTMFYKHEEPLQKYFVISAPPVKKEIQ